jgi:glutathione S-transferase
MLLFGAGINFETYEVNIFNGELKSEAYLKINPKGTIPCVVFDGKPMNESYAIMRHVCSVYPSADKFYP